jgi:ribonuclease P protein component
LLERGKREKTEIVDVFLARSPVPFSRLGLIVPKYGRRIVDRNRLKRRLREIGRQDVLPRLNARGLQLDVLIRARSGAYRVAFQDLRREVGDAVEGLCSEPS